MTVSQSMCVWVYDIDGAKTLAFTELGIENLREIIKGQIDKTGRSLNA